MTSGPNPPQQLAGMLVDLSAQMAPMYEFAGGQREELQRRGWSPTMAEQIAGELLTLMLQAAFKQVAR